ncbi:hypothetical protein, partial [Muribaculum intestinale]
YFRPLFGRYGTPELPHHKRKSVRRLTALSVTFIIKQALNYNRVKNEKFYNILDFGSNKCGCVCKATLSGIQQLRQQSDYRLYG